MTIAVSRSTNFAEGGRTRPCWYRRGWDGTCHWFCRQRTAGSGVPAAIRLGRLRATRFGDCRRSTAESERQHPVLNCCTAGCGSLRQLTSFAKIGRPQPVTGPRLFPPCRWRASSVSKSTSSIRMTAARRRVRRIGCQASTEAAWKVGRSAISGVFQPLPMSRSSILGRSERSAFRAMCVARTFHTASTLT